MLSPDGEPSLAGCTMKDSSDLHLYRQAPEGMSRGPEQSDCMWSVPETVYWCCLGMWPLLKNGGKYSAGVK